MATQSAGRGTSFSTQRRIRAAKANEFAVISSFNLGYRNREDKTNLPGNVLITGSQNVLTNVSGRVGNRKGYTLDGATSTVIAPILSSYDWQMHSGVTQHLRAGFLTSAGNDGKLQYRYDDGTITWRDLLTGLTSVNFNFTDFWDNTGKQSLCLMVNGASSITEWNGGITTLKSVSTAGICKNGTTTWAQDSFYVTGTHTVVIAGVSYVATSGWTTNTLRGITPDPSAATPGEVVHQAPETTLNSVMTNISLGTNDLIANLSNQIFVGSFTEQLVLVSNVNNYKSYAYSTPRLPGEGFVGTIRASPKAFIQQEDTMYISAGDDQWYQFKTTLSSDLTNEKAEMLQLKTSTLQGSQSQGLTSKIADNVVFLSNEPIVRTLGLVPSIFVDPHLTDISNSIVNDINATDFTDGQILLHKNFVYLTAPKDSKVFIYNMTSPKDIYWEAPQTLPVGRLSIIDGDLYGHSYLTSETYKLFDGYNDNGGSMNASAIFAFDSYKERPTSKGFNQFYIEGYISSNTELDLNLQYDLDGCATAVTYPISGMDARIVCIGSDDNLLGKESLGKNPLGGNLNQITPTTLPPKFRAIKTFPMKPFYEYSPSFSSTGVDQQWEVLAFGPAWSPTAEGNVAITE
jgi:hypothetical protein